MTMRYPSWITRYRPPVHPCAATSLRSACGPSVRVVPSACDQKGSSVKRTRKPTSTVQFQWAAAFATVQRMTRVAKQRNGSKRCGRRRRRRRLLFRCSRVVVDVGGGGAAVHRSRRGAARGALCVRPHALACNACCLRDLVEQHKLCPTGGPIGCLIHVFL